jgi:CheY-like chemotaxis protein
MNQRLPKITLTGASLSPLSEIDPLMAEEIINHSVEGLERDIWEKRILIVDDDPSMLMLVSKMALHLGYRPKTVADGVEALFQVGQSAFKLIITDYDMPLMNGLQLADQIKKKLLDIPVIIMTGNHDNGLLNDIKASGLITDVLLKPFKLGTLREKIEIITHHGPVGWVS